MRVRVDESTRPVWTVTGQFRGTSPEVVILGNHRDAWAYGGVDPSSGSAALVELARVFGGLGRDGWRPRRSVLFASWDGEEQGLMSSTEWGEQHEEWLNARAVAYFNVDSAVSGRRFTAAGHATLGRLLMEVAEVVRDPVAGVSLATLARDHARSERRQDPTGSQAAVFDDRLGGGSDYTVFANYLGIPVADLAFDGPYPVYHTLYDTHRWVAEKVDRGFVYHAAFVKILGLAVLRLAQADALPLDLAASAAQIAEHVRGASSEWQQVADDRTVAEMDRAADALVAAAAAFDESRMGALARQDSSALAELNARALRFERAFIDRAGLPERPWYRHLVHAPHFSYAPEMLPGIEAALRQHDRRLFEQEAMRVVAALQRAAATLREGRQH
jgi:N-acetylated-alpha-linked acidic dipeptidase